jgi:hypothetical protein
MFLAPRAHRSFLERSEGPLAIRARRVSLAVSAACKLSTAPACSRLIKADQENYSDQEQHLTIETTGESLNGHITNIVRILEWLSTGLLLLCGQRRLFGAALRISTSYRETLN